METTVQTASRFTPRTLDRAEAETARIADRWAPEGVGALRTPALRALSFVDHLLAPQRTFADAPVSNRARRTEGFGGRGGSAWWMFPVPWYAESFRHEQSDRPAIVARARRDADVAMGRRPAPSSVWPVQAPPRP